MDTFVHIRRSRYIAGRVLLVFTLMLLLLQSKQNISLSRSILSPAGSGVVRHVSPIRMDGLRILTHDLLVTSGDYADPNVVSTSVINHHFRWRASGATHVDGRINLLHTVPASEAVYRRLMAVRKWDEVMITGREIKAIKAYRRDDGFLLDWRDSGCNTILVESVSIVGE